MIENKEMAKVVRRIAGIFAGEDGGIGFVTFARHLNEFQKRADKGCEKSKKVLEVVTRFDLLIRVILEKMR